MKGIDRHFFDVDRTGNRAAQMDHMQARLLKEKLPFIQCVELKDEAQHYTSIEPDAAMGPSPWSFRTSSQWPFLYWPSEGDYPAAVMLSSSNLGKGYTQEEDGYFFPEMKHLLGTQSNQIVLNAAELVGLVYECEWSGVHLVDGHPAMMWALWAMCRGQDIRCTGFDPSSADEARYIRAEASLSAYFSKEDPKMDFAPGQDGVSATVAKPDKDDKDA